MIHKSIDITGAGDHVIATVERGEMIIPMLAMLTFSHSEDQSQKVSFLAGSDIISGPFYVTDGGEILYHSANGRPLKFARGQAFSIRLSAGVSCAGYVQYEVGS